MVKYVEGVDSLEDKKNYGDLLMLAIKSILLALCGVVFPFLYIFLKLNQFSANYKSILYF